MTKQETTTEGALGWDANFKLSWDILENSIKDADGIKSNVRINPSFRINDLISKQFR